MFKLASLAIALSVGVSATSYAAAFNAAPIATDSVVKTTGAKLTPQQRLQRLLRPHTRAGNPITRSVRAAAGDPKLRVIDHRAGGYGETYQCSFITKNGVRKALICQ